MAFAISPKQGGFTLVELVIVIILLAILGIAVSHYIGFGTLLYRDVAARENILNSARFAIERLNREVRSSLPNSQQITNNGNCLRFVPVVASSQYLELAVAPAAPSNRVTSFALDGYIFQASHRLSHRLAVYALSSDDIYGASSTTLKAFSDYSDSVNPAEFSFASPVRWPLASPSQRLYLVERPVRYCVLSNGNLQREVLSWASESPPEQVLETSLMAEQIQLLAITAPNYQPPFAVREATLSRNGVVKIFLNFVANEGAESLVFHHSIHIQNVP
ncbi:PilW family protein [Motilimonas eburnea]|uniref:PilW family protein n=1 Tax=Motilimonas eburnea TaxID=1737488 RepID=UPI001E3F4D33|nr:type II secretion system protein [Motilimonas eburnea]MCE2572123.1 type II secretion system GspH family protein [Motilimonas eburnea]